jgi:hypothetical protein
MHIPEEGEDLFDEDQRGIVGADHAIGYRVVHVSQLLRLRSHHAFIR